MPATLTIVRYPKRYIFFGLLSMAAFHIPCFLKRNISFYKLLGCGRNGSFDKHPDWQQWGIMAVHKNITDGINQCDPSSLYGWFIAGWFRILQCEVCTFLLEPVEGHGTWDKKEAFGKLPRQSDYRGPVAILTRATIRWSKLNSFWNNVAPVASQMNKAEGFVASIGIGELPYIKQATFSIWKDKDAMKQFAYKMQSHAEVIRKTRQENWYSEDMFVRFIPVKAYGTIRGVNPLQGIT